MHMQGTPQTMQANPAYDDVVRDVDEFFGERAAAIERSCGVAAEQVVLDVGIGFGKTLEHNLQLLAALGSFTKLGRPLLLGVSRKSFIGNLTRADVSGTIAGSLACACLAVAAGVQIIRTHDVAETVRPSASPKQFWHGKKNLMWNNVIQAIQAGLAARAGDSHPRGGDLFCLPLRPRHARLAGRDRVCHVAAGPDADDDAAESESVALVAGQCLARHRARRPW